MKPPRHSPEKAPDAGRIPRASAASIWSRIDAKTVALLYAAMGAAWIFASDWLLDMVFKAPPTFSSLQTAKGLFYIAITAGLVYWLARKAVDNARNEAAAAELQVKERTFESILGSLGEAVVVVNPATRTITRCNPATERLFGYPPRSLQGQSTRILYPDQESYEKFGRLSEPELARSNVFQTEYQLVKRNGTPVEVEITVEALRPDLDWEQGVVSIIHDVTARKQFEATLRDSETRFRQLVELLPVAIYVCDSEGMINHYNQAAIDLWGQEPGTDNEPGRICGSHRMYLPDGRPLPKENCPLAKTLQTKRPVRDMEIVVERPDKSRARAIVNTVPLFDAAGNMIAAVGSLLDITELRAAESSARRARKISRDTHARLEQLVQRLPDAVFIKDRDLKYTLINEAGVSVTGVALEHILGRDDLALFEPDRARRIVEFDRALMEDGNVVTLEEDFTDHDGRTRHLSTTKGALYTSDGEIDGLFGIARDITEEKRLRAALEERVKELRTLYEATRCLNSLDTSFEQRLEILVQLVPKGWLYPEISRARVVFGDRVYTTPEFKETPWIQSSPISQFNRAIGRLDVALLEQKPDRDEGPFLVEERNLLDTIARAIGEAAERRQLEEQYQQAQRMESIGRLAGGIAHDFNNILAVILGYAEAALLELPAGTQSHKDLEQIHASGRRAANLTRQLLAFARQEVISPVDLPLNETVSDIVLMLKRLLTEDIDVQWHPSNRNLVVSMDEGQFQQILINLAVNARDAMDGHGTLTIATDSASLNDPEDAREHDVKPGRFAVLHVQDNGAGMDAETLSQIFEPFFTTKSKEKGTGLGLATVYGIVKQNGGFIHAESTPGKGATFSVYLPRIKAKGKNFPAQTPWFGGDTGTETVLLVEDELQLLNLNTRIIESLGYTVLPAQSPAKALELARNDAGNIALVITDIVMPEMNGRELQQELARVRPDVKCLFTSGYTRDVIVERGILEQDVHFLSKPFTRKRLANKIREVLDS